MMTPDEILRQADEQIAARKSSNKPSTASGVQSDDGWRDPWSDAPSNRWFAPGVRTDGQAQQQSSDGFGARLKQGIGRAVDSAQVALSGDEGVIAKVAADQQRNALPQTALQRQMAEEIAPYNEAAKNAEGFVDSARAWGALGLKRAGQLISNPAEAGKMIVEQLPNSIPGLAGGFAGAKAGAAVGTAFGGPVGTVIGGIGGGLLGGFAGGYGLEKGASVLEQVQEKAHQQGIDLQDQNSARGFVAKNLAEIDEAATRKAVGTAGTDAALNVLTMGAAGLSGRGIVNEARALAKAVDDGIVSAADATAALARLEAANAARNTVGQKALRGGAVVGAEMAGEGISEAVGQKYAYGEVDPGQVIDEALLGLGQGGAMALGGKAFRKAAGLPDNDDAATRSLDDVHSALAKNAGVQPDAALDDGGMAREAQNQNVLALPAPVIDVSGDGLARTADDRNARLQRIATGDITDVTPIERATPVEVKPSEAMGLRTGPDAGPLENAAALSVDTGATAQMQGAAGIVANDLQSEPQAANAIPVVNFDDVADPYERAMLQRLYDDHFADGDLESVISANAELDTSFDFGANVNQLLANAGATPQEIEDAQRGQASAQAADRPGQAQENDRGDFDAELSVAKNEGDGSGRLAGAEQGEASQQPLDQQAAAPGSQAEGANVATLAQLNRKKLAEMSDDELQQLSSLLPADHSRQQKIQKAIQTRAAQAQAAINEGVKADGTQADQAQQAGPQPTQAGAAQAGQPAGQGLNNGATPAENDGRQASAPTAPQAQAQELDRQQRAKRMDDAGAQWARMSFAERSALVGRMEGVKPVLARNMPRAEWGKLNAGIQRELANAMAPQATQSVGDETPFAADSGTLGIPRSEMPQVPTANHGGLVKHLNALGIAHETKTVDAADLKPTQAEYSPSKVEAAKTAGGDRAVIVSSDGHIIDGHHQAVAAAEEGKPVKAIVLDAPVEQALEAVKASPSANLMQADKDSGKLEVVHVGDKKRADAQAAPAFAAGQRVHFTSGLYSGNQGVVESISDAGRIVVRSDAGAGFGVNPSEYSTLTEGDAPSGIQGEEPTPKAKPRTLNGSDTKKAEALFRASAANKPSKDAQEQSNAATQSKQAQAATEQQAAPGRQSAESAYTLPAGSINDDWRDEQKREPNNPGYAPTPRQQRLMNEVKKVLDSGAFYNDDVTDKVAKALGVSDEVLASNRTGVQNGDFGYDVYHARKAVEAKALEADAAKIRAELNLRAGDKLGTLIFNDFKQTNSVEVVSITEDGHRASLKGKRGAFTVTFETTVPTVRFAIERAHERGKRKDSYEEFIAGRAADKQAAEQPQNQAQQAQSATKPESSAATDFIPAPDGGLDYGEITPEMGRAMRRQAGKIRLRQGNEAWGLTHIENRHGKDFAALGFKSARDFVSQVASGFTKIYKGRGAALDVVLESDKAHGMLIVSLELSPDGDFYDIKTATPIRRDQFKNEKPLWERAGPSSPVVDDNPPYPKGQSGSASVQPAPVVAKAAKPAAIEDFGEKLEGARKDLPPSLKEDVSDEQMASLPLSKIWPANAHEEIQNDAAAALAFAARQEIPAKPRQSVKVQRWVQKVKNFRALVTSDDALAGNLDKLGLDGLSQRVVAGSVLEGFFAKVRLLAQLPRDTWGRVEKVGEYPDAVRYGEDGKKTPIPFSAVVIDGEAHQFDGAKSIGPDEVSKIKELLGAAAPQKGGLTAADFEIRTYKNRAESFINRKGDKEMRPLKTFTGQESGKQAREWLKANVAQAEAQWEAVKARDNVGKSDVRTAQNRQRVGADHRKGADVTAQMFEDAFGFRGVQFGNWVAQGAGAKDRQGLLNEAYDALMDLSLLLGVPSRAMSLDGSLGLSLGARGSGKAAAHFEPDSLVINLTKTKGAGSLAHEWFHALDNYFRRQRGGMDKQAGREDAYITYKPEAAWVPKAGTRRAAAPLTSGQLRQWLQARGMYDSGKSLEENAQAANFERDPQHKDGVRPQVEAAFAQLVQALNDSPMAARATVLDGGAVKGYWGRIIERGARSFENYVINKMALQGYSNDFLANIRSFDEWQALGKNAERYPYLTPAEEGPVVEAFDNLFETIETRQGDDGNVAMFSRMNNNAATQGVSNEQRQTPNGIPAGLPATSDPDSQYLERRINNWLQTSGWRADRVSAVSLPIELRTALDRFTDTTGTRVVLFRNLTPEIEDFNGVNFRDGRVFINETSQHPATLTAAHEWVHNLKRTNPELYQLLEDEVRDQGRIPEWHQRNTQEEGQDRGIDHAVEELTAAAASDAMTDPAFLEQLAQRNQGVFRRVARAFLDFLDTLTAGWRDQGSNAYLRDVQAFRDKLADVLDRLPATGQGTANFAADPARRPGSAQDKAVMQTETEAFKRWFGGSKVVDADGNPMVVYHGTRGEFTKFDLERAGSKTDSGGWGRGIYFAADPEYAGAYAGRTEGSNIIPAYIALQNPLVVDARERTAAIRGIGLEVPRGDPTPAWSQQFANAVAQRGYDGVLVTLDGAPVEIVAFHPEQIKSATGNNGNFDPEDADILNFGADDVQRNISNGIKAVTAMDVKRLGRHKLTDWLKLGLPFLGRRQLVDVYGDLIPQMRDYDRLAAQMEADKNESGAEADELVRRWAKLPDEGKLADLMHDATLAQIDADSDVAAAADDDRAQATTLKARFKALSPEAQAVYRESRDGYKAHHEKVRKAIRERIERSELSSEKRHELLTRMDDDFFQKVKGVYFPLARFGRYVAVVKDGAGQVVSVSRAETMPEAESARAALLKAFPTSQGFTVGRVTLDKEFVASHKMVGRGFMTDLYRALEGVDLPAQQLAELEDTLGQLYLSSLPDLSWAKHGIHRKGTPGFSQDARRAFAQNMFHGARYLAKLRYSDVMQDNLDAMQKHVDEWAEVTEDFDQPKAQRVVDEMAKRHDSMMNPKSNPLSTALTSFGFLYYLGLSPAAAVVNLSQTAMVAYPVMAGKWGYKKAGDALLRASKESVAGKNNIRTQLTDKDEIAAYEQAVNSGVIDVTMAHDLAGIAQGEDQKVSWALRPVMRMASYMFHQAELFNRQSTFMAAFRLAREAGAAPKDAYEQAVKATYDGHFDYGAANRPRVMQGNVARVVLLFKQFAQNMIYTMARQAYQSVAGKSPEERRQARKVFAGLMTTHAMAAGVLGLPLVGPLLAAASMLGSDDDEPWDAEAALRNMLAETVGQKPAEVIAKGVSRLTPWDISGRVGLDDLIFPDVREGLEGQRLAETFATGMLGPVMGIATNAAKAAQKMGDGDYGRALEDLLPIAARNPIKAARYWFDGAQDRSGVPIKDEVSAAGSLGQAVGFSPSEVRLAQEGKTAVLDADRRLSERRSELLSQFAKAAMGKDEEGMAKANDAIVRFNERNPGMRITAPQKWQSVRRREQRIRDSDNGIYLPSKRRDAMDAGRFAFEQ